MTLDRVDNVTYLPLASAAEEVGGDVQKPVAHAESAFVRTLDAATLPSAQDQSIQDQSVRDIRVRLEDLVAEPTIMTDSSPAIREQIGSLEALLADARHHHNPDTMTPGVIVELHPGVRFDAQTGRLQFDTSAGVTLDESIWRNSDQLDRTQIQTAATTLTERVISADSVTSTVQSVQVQVPAEIINQLAEGEAIVVTGNGEYQLVRSSGDFEQVEAVRVLEADGTLISASLYEADRSHRYREYYDDGTIGLEISYDSDSVVRQVDYFDARGSATTSEFYDQDGALTQSNQFDAEGQVARKEFY